MTVLSVAGSLAFGQCPKQERKEGGKQRRTKGKKKEEGRKGRRKEGNTVCYHHGALERSRNT